MKPILLAVDDQEAPLKALEADLLERYGAHYEVVTHTSARAALKDIEDIGRRSQDVALLIADQWMQEMTGIEFLIEAHPAVPDAKRLLVIDVGDISAEQPISKAMTLNQLDFFFGKPWASPEEEMFPVTGEALREWGKQRLPRYEKAKVVDHPGSTRARELEANMELNGVACGFYPSDTAKGRDLLELHSISDDRLPAVILYNGEVLFDPPDLELAEALGAKIRPDPGLYDVTIVGAGPAGLAAAVYGASEGLRTLVLECLAVGGQAVTSPRIRNYLGFPWGLSGRELVDRAGRQAASFGASTVFSAPAVRLSTKGEERLVTLANGRAVLSRSVVITTGVSYRRLEAPGVDDLIGAGVFYGAAAVSEGRALQGEDVFMVGAGNSAGQAAVQLARGGARVTLLVRGGSLAKKMSAYLIRELDATANITVSLNTRVVEARGDHRLEELVLEDLAAHETQTVPAGALFVLIGTEPHTQWLAGTVARDAQGYVLTGRDLDAGTEDEPQWPLERAPLLLETSLPGVFAAGDVRHRSMKRVAAATGEGATSIQMVHEYLDAV